MYPYYKSNKRSKKKKCYIYKKADGTEKELNLKVHRSFLLFRYFNSKIPEDYSPLIPTVLPIQEMHLIYKCVLFSYLSYKDRTKIVFPPEIKIEYEAFDSDVRRIPFFIASDSSTNSIIVSCRGSSCKDDFITDSLGNGISYGGGRFHEGIFSTASYVFLTCQTKVLELDKLYNDSSMENDDDKSTNSDSYKNYSDDGDFEEESESEEEDEIDELSANSNENFFSFHKSTSISNLSRKSSISLQRSASSEELYMHHKPLSKTEKDTNIQSDLNGNENDILNNDTDVRKRASKQISKTNKNQNSNEKINEQKSKSNLKKIPHPVRKSTSDDDLSSHHNASIPIQRSLSSDKFIMNFKQVSDNMSDSNQNESNLNESSRQSKSKRSSKKQNKPKNLYENYKNQKSNSIPVLIRKSTSEANFKALQKSVTVSHKKSTSINNLHQRFNNLDRIHQMNKNADSEEEGTNIDNNFVSKMLKKRTKIIITGHSLGASVAAVVAYLFREKFPELDVQCICFAPPPTISFNLWRTSGHYIKSFMIEGDVVPFLSVRNLLSISDIMFPHQHSNKKFKKFIISYLEKKSLEQFHVNKALNEKLYPPGQMYLIRFTNNNESGILSLKKRIKNSREKRKNKKNDEEDVKDDHIQLCQILNPDYFSNLVKNIQENNHAVKNYMRLIIRLMNKFRKQMNCV